MTQREVETEGATDAAREGGGAAAENEERWRRSMVAAQSGDAEVYRTLLEELVPVIRRQVRAKLAHAMAEDVVQNALLSIHRARHTYRPERPFGPWMRAIVRNATIDALREMKRRGDREVGVESPDWLPDPSGASGGPPPVQRALERRELSPELSEALEQLPAAQREAVVLIQVEGLSVAEAAARAGVTAGALKVRAHRGYRALRARLEGKDR